MAPPLKTEIRTSMFDVAVSLPVTVPAFWLPPGIGQLAAIVVLAPFAAPLAVVLRRVAWPWLRARTRRR